LIAAMIRVFSSDENKLQENLVPQKIQDTI